VAVARGKRISPEKGNAGRVNLWLEIRLLQSFSRESNMLLGFRGSGCNYFTMIAIW
jgi:hypothetical protein